MESTRARRMKKKSEKSNKVSTSDLLDPQNMELQKSSPHSLNEEAAAGSFEKQFFGHCFYRFREQVLVDAWPELESAAKKHGLFLTLHRDNIFYVHCNLNNPLDKGSRQYTNTEWRCASRIHHGCLVGHEKGGLCLKHGITKGNSIAAVGDSLPHVKLIGHYAEACIVRNMKPASVLERVKVKYDRCVIEMQLEALSI